MSKKILVASTLIMFALGSCYKNEKKDIPTYNSLTDAFATLAPASKTVNMDAATGGSFRGNSGARYEFPPNAFVTGTGTAVTGTVVIEVKEYLTKSDMLYSGVLPMTDSESLISGGEVYVHATQGGQELFLRPGTTYSVNLAQNGTPVAGMKVFQGHETTAGVLWVPKPDSGIAKIVYNGDTIEMFTDSLEYANADKFMSTPHYQTFQISLSTSNGVAIPAANYTTSTAIVAHCLYDEFNGIYKLLYTGNGFINVNHIPDIPVHFVVTALIEGQFYGGILGATPTTGNTYSVLLKPTTPAEFKTLIDAL